MNFDREKIVYDCTIDKIDIENKIVITDQEEYKYEKLITSIPLHNLLDYLRISHDLSWNKILVINIGFDKKTEIKDMHWIYVPEKEINFYRIGFYDNVRNENRGSIYVEIAFGKDDVINFEEEYDEALYNMKKMGIIKEQKAIAHDFLIIEPAYVYIRKNDGIPSILNNLLSKGIYTVGRYGCWDYYSMEDSVYVAEKIAYECLG